MTTTKSKRPEITFEEPEPVAPPAKASHRTDCSCHKDLGAYCCGAGSLRLTGGDGVAWHVDSACPWRPEGA